MSAMVQEKIQRLFGQAAEFRRSLADWYARHKRPLPWRENPSLYKTVVSEFMLQQTQVETVLPYFRRWMETFPDFETLAKASFEKVLKFWEGLGYYSRARNLHRLAQAVTTLTLVPPDASAWRQLPGVGPYTAAAITSIAFGTPIAVIDGNVIRILSRILADDVEFKGNADAIKRLESTAEALLDSSNPGDHNQAMMELGATVCVRRKPLCLICPVRGFCAAGQAGNPEDYPKIFRRETEYVVVERVWIVHDGALLLHQAPANARWLADIFELPRREWLDERAVGAARAELFAIKKRTITHHAIEERIYRVAPTARLCKKLSSTEGFAWVPLAEIDAVTLSGPHRRWIAELLPLSTAHELGASTTSRGSARNP